MFATRRNQSSGFRSQRSLALGRGGAVCTSQVLASTAALRILRDGGNAIDAAVCAAAVLGVVEPFSTGIGGDCFALVWSARDGKLHGINGSGRAPAGLSCERLRQQGHTAMPMHGMLPVTIPGALDAWQQLLERFGTIALGKALEPAIHYASEGFAVSEIIQHQWQLILRFGVVQHPDALRTLTCNGEPPALGEIFRMPELAASMRRIAAGGSEVFYRGELAEKLVAFAQANGGPHQLADFASHRSSWVEPIATEYRGYRVCEIPPNGQGLAALLGLNILECFAPGELGSAESLHLRIEAVKLAYADRSRYIADPEHSRVPVAELLDKAYAAERAGRIDPRRAAPAYDPGDSVRGDTVYLATADAEGNVVSLINSLYLPFGSGLVAGDTGIVLHNRGFGFSLDPSHPNCVAPGKRPFHTIIPGMMLKNGRPLLAFGVMGGDVQAQAHLQLISNLIDHGLNIQEGLDYPRFNYLEANRVAFEAEHDPEVLRALAAMGHEVLDENAALLRGGFGGGQGIAIDRNGTYWAGSDRRKDGCAVVL
ncbi:MAG TPA: gamma-glutamyltransferase [Terriglobales bacterium]|nr:gamma-glutamyltransferase [Terriglobales bacterium]